MVRTDHAEKGRFIITVSVKRHQDYENKAALHKDCSAAL